MLVFIVINECAIGNGGCQHICVDTYDGFCCMCRLGYDLRPLADIGCDCKYTRGILVTLLMWRIIRYEYHLYMTFFRERWWIVDVYTKEPKIDEYFINL